MSAIEEIVSLVPGFYKKTSVDHLLLLGWALHSEGRSHFDAAALRDCFREANLDPPNLTLYLQRLASKKPPQLRKEREGYRLAASVKKQFDDQYGADQTVFSISKILQDLPTKVPDLSERIFLLEALSCYRVGAFRAAIVMIWNLTYDHLCRWLISDAARLASFNLALANRFPKKGLTITELEGFSECKESEMIEVCRSSGILSKNVCAILKDKLARRNIAAHPSNVTITQHQADDMISDLVNNVVTQLL